MKLAIFAILGGLAATAANAGGYVAPVAESPMISVEAPVAIDWSGFYAGLQYGRGKIELTYPLWSDETKFDAYGVHAGYLHDFGRFVLGAEMDYDRVSLENIDLDADLSRVRVRAGYDLGRFLPYVTLGSAHLEGDRNLSEDGVTYGIGAEYLVTDRFSLGAEYSRAEFKDVADVDDADLDTDLFQIRASFHF